MAPEPPHQADHTEAGGSDELKAAVNMLALKRHLPRTTSAEPARSNLFETVDPAAYLAGRRKGEQTGHDEGGCFLLTGLAEREKAMESYGAWIKSHHEMQIRKDIAQGAWNLIKFVPITPSAVTVQYVETLLQLARLLGPRS
jgi:hypothetical protein